MSNTTLLLICFSPQSVATIGSTVTSVHHDVETMQAAIEAHKKTIETLQNEMVRIGTDLIESHCDKFCLNCIFVF